MGLTNFPNGISSFGIPVVPGPSVFGHYWFVDTTLGSDGYQGTTPQRPFATMEAALDVVGDNDVIYFVGTVREQLVAPLGVTGVSIIGNAGGQVRDDNGAKWTYPASGAVAGQALLELREQGWSLQNFLMTPDATGGACIKAHRNEDATYPDSSHFVCRGMRFVGAGGTPIGIEDVGGNSNYLIENCQFQSLTSAITCTSTAIAIPLRNRILNNVFLLNTNDITTSLSYGIIAGNQFMTAGSGSTNKVISTTFNATQGGNNHVTLNWFTNTEAQIAPGSGYTGASTDMWGNYVTDQAALAVGQPA